MKFALTQLDGEAKGKIRHFDCTRLLIGKETRNDLVFPEGTSHPHIPSQVELSGHNQDMYFRNLDASVTTLVNDNPLTEGLLSDKDILQLGTEGPKLQIHIRPEEPSQFQPARRSIRDALDAALDEKQHGQGSIRPFFSHLANDLRHHTSPLTQFLLVMLLLLLVGGLGGVTYYFYTTQQTQTDSIDALLQELEKAQITQAELEKRAEAERQRITKTFTDRIDLLEQEQHSAAVLIKRLGPSVCFLYGAYGFLPKGHSEGTPSRLFEYTGTGFLIDDNGLMVTNRHLMEPWHMDQSGTELIQRGFHPQLVTLQAYFPGNPKTYDVSVQKKSKDSDVGLGQLSPVPQGVSPITIPASVPQGIIGEAVVVLGYPVGVEGVLARMDEHVADTLLRQPNLQLGQLVRNIVEHGGIRPWATQGHIGDIVPGRIVYDAQTTGGASGSPVFNSRGDLIAVNAAYMKRFSGGSFGVPISKVYKLLHQKPD